MNPIETHITVDLASANNFGYVRAVQGDQQSRFVYVTLLDNSQPYSLPSDATIVFRGDKPDGTTIFNYASLSSTGEIVIELDAQVLAASGEGNYEVALYGDDETVLSTFPFRVYVSPTAFNMYTVASSNEFQVLAEAVADLTQLQEMADQATTAATNASSSASAAKTSETNAASSATKAAKSETNAKTSETNAASSEANAKTSETNAATSEANAATSASNASKSEANASVYATNAKTSANNSATSATKAANSATAAATSATNAATSETNAATSESNAAKSEANAKTSETNAATSESNAKASETAAATSATNAATSEANAKKSAEDAAQSLANIGNAETNCENYAVEAESWAHGGTGTRTGEDSDNAKYYYEQAKGISIGLNGALLPMGTITYENLQNQTKQAGYMYNISDEFTSDETFKDGGGITYPAGTNVYYTSDGYWDCLAGAYSSELEELQAMVTMLKNMIYEGKSARGILTDTNSLLVTSGGYAIEAWNKI